MDSKITSLNQVVLAQQLVIILFIGTTDIAQLYQSVVPMNKMITGRINYPQLHSLLVTNGVSATYRCVSGSYILSFVILPGIFSCYCLVAIAGLVSGKNCGPVFWTTCCTTCGTRQFNKGYHAKFHLWQAKSPISLSQCPCFYCKVYL